MAQLFNKGHVFQLLWEGDTAAQGDNPCLPKACHSCETTYKNTSLVG